MNKMKLVCLVLACVLLLCGCGSSAEPTLQTSTESPTIAPTTVPVETETGSMGFTLDEAENTNGVYYILEDGSFAPYLCHGALHSDSWSNVFYTPMWSANSNPALTQNDTIAIFNDKRVQVEILPVIFSGTTVSLMLDDGRVILDPRKILTDLHGNTYLNAIVKDTGDKTKVPLIYSSTDYLFGTALDKKEYTVYYSENGQEHNFKAEYYSIPEDTDVTISLVDGTKVNQITAEADYYFYGFLSDQFKQSLPDGLWIYTTNLPRIDANAIPTVEGYAAVHLENVPAGQYVMIITDEDNCYWCTVLSVE